MAWRSAEREAIIDLWDRDEISDDVLRRIERDLDLAELRMRIASSSRSVSGPPDSQRRRYDNVQPSQQRGKCCSVT